MIRHLVDGAIDKTASERRLRHALPCHRMLSLLFTYAELRDADLDRDVSFLESTTGRWLTPIHAQGLPRGPRDTGRARAIDHRPRDGPVERALTRAFTSAQPVI
jgi:hypothetical protein